MAEGYKQFDQKPFVRKHLDTADDVITVRLNDVERVKLNEFKALMSIDGDSTAFKKALIVAMNVLLSTFGKETMAYLSSPRRVRPLRKQSSSELDGSK